LVSLDALLKKDPMASLSAKTYELTKWHWCYRGKQGFYHPLRDVRYDDPMAMAHQEGLAE
jgi:hypothetical protein